MNMRDKSKVDFPVGVGVDMIAPCQRTARAIPASGWTTWVTRS
ncbi:hypothetical protein [Sphingomonas daechungensis]